jgi:hypothetical protein
MVATAAIDDRYLPGDAPSEVVWQVLLEQRLLRDPLGDASSGFRPRKGHEPSDGRLTLSAGRSTRSERSDLQHFRERRVPDSNRGHHDFQLCDPRI